MKSSQRDYETKGTPEEIAAAEAAIFDLENRGLKNTTEWRRANFLRTRLLRRAGPGPETQQTAQTWRAAVIRNRELRAGKAQEKAEKAQINLAEMMARVNGPLLAKNANAVLEKGPEVLAILSEAMRSKTFRERKWAVDTYSRLLVSLTGKQMAQEPVKKVQARQVRVTWPAEGQKA